MPPTLVNGKTCHTGGQRDRDPPGLKQLQWLLGGSHRSSRNQGPPSQVGGLLGQLEGRGWGETCVYHKCVVLVLGLGSGFFRRLLPSALCPLPSVDEDGPRLPAHHHPPPLLRLLGTSAQDPCLHLRTLGLNLRHLEVHLDPSSNLLGTSDKLLPLVASDSLNLSSPSESPPSLVVIPGLWQGVCDAGVCNPHWETWPLDDEPRP